MHFIKKRYGVILVFLLSFWAVRHLFAPGFFPMHDDTQVARVFEMGKMLKEGMFPVRWVPDLGYGYGYPIFNFYAPLAYYFGGFLTLLGFDALIATKIMMVVGILLSGVFMYLLAREFWGELGGIVSALFYVYAPYHALDIYVRGDVAEFWGYAFIPLMFLGFYKVLYNSPSRSRFATPRRWRGNDLDSFEVDIRSVWKWIVIGSLGYAAVILSHNLTALMVTPFLAIVILLFCFIAYKNKKLHAIRYTLYAFILGLLLSAFYWIPALFEMKYTNVLSQISGGADFRDHFVCLFQLWDSAWGFGGSARGCIDGLSFKLGKLHIASLVLALVGAIYLWKKDKFRSVVILFSIFYFLFSIFMMFEISKPVWETIPLMAFFQYPWRFLILASFFSSFLAGFYVWYLKAKFSDLKYFNTVPYLSIGGLIFLLINFNFKLFQPQTLVLKTANDYTNEIALKWTASRISDEYLPPNFRKPKSEKEIARSPAIRPKETTLEKVSNIISLLSSLSLITGIILFKSKAKA